MKKTLLTLALLALAMIAGAQDKTNEKPYTREGDTFIETAKAGGLMMKGDQLTAYLWRDAQGKEYPIILHTYTKGEKAGRTTAYVIRTSKKSGKEYRYFIPNGEEIATEIINENK